MDKNWMQKIFPSILLILMAGILVCLSICTITLKKNMASNFQDETSDPDYVDLSIDGWDVRLNWDNPTTINAYFEL